MLCDAAQVAEGKLFVLGGGWSVSRGPGVVNMGLAIKISVPWHEANMPHPMVAQLMTEDGTAVEVEGRPLRVEGSLEVGRPAGTKSGTPLDAPLALNFAGVPLPPGGYRWELLIDESKVAEQSFQVAPLSVS